MSSPFDLSSWPTDEIMKLLPDYKERLKNAVNLHGPKNIEAQMYRAWVAALSFELDRRKKP
jgi:hypothetical protein